MLITTRASQENELSDFGESIGNTRYCTVGNDFNLMIVSWGEILNLLMAAAQAAADEITSDIYQMQSLCSRIEGEAFLPFGSEELTGLHQPRRNRDLCDLVDAITNGLRDRGLISLAGLKATPQRDGYTRYIWLSPKRNVGGAFIALRYDLWLKFELSPIWLGTQSHGRDALLPILREIASSLGTEVVEEGKVPHLPIPIKTDLEFDEVTEAAASIVADAARRLTVASS
jgi:hypothetical protein